MKDKDKGGRPRLYSAGSVRVCYTLPLGLERAIVKAVDRGSDRSSSRLVSSLLLDAMLKRKLITAKLHKDLQPLGVDHG